MRQQNRRKKKQIMRHLIRVIILVFFACAGLFIFRFHSESLKTVTYHAENVMTHLGINVEFPEIKVNEEDLKDKYYYQVLSEGERVSYKEILQGLSERQGEINVHAADADTVNRIFQYVLYDYPEIFWCDGRGETTSYSKKLGNVKKYSAFRPAYNCTKEEMERKKAKIDQTVKAFVKTIKEDATEAEKVKAVYDYIITSTSYEKNSEENQNISSVLLYQRSVCAGYAKTTQYLLNRLGMTCTYVVGTASDQSGNYQPHAWNLVTCDGEKYYVDTTWGDSSFLDTENRTVEGDYICYDYLLCTTKELAVTHKWDQEVHYPNCTATKDNYYRKQGKYYQEANQEELIKAMNQDIQKKRPESEFKFSDAKTYKKGKKMILNTGVKTAAQNLMRRYNLTKVSYSYSEAKNNHRITIFWNYE